MLKRICPLSCLVWFAATTASAQPLQFSENFDNGNNTFAQLQSRGWAFVNNSTLAVPPGTPDAGPWNVGIGGLSDAASLPGSVNGQYWASDFRATGDVTATGGTISDWLITPQMSFTNGVQIRFFTRTFNPEDAPNRMQVRLSTSGASTDVGTTTTSVGVFSNLLADINATQTPNAYPVAWQQQTLTLSGLTGVVNGRLAFRHFVTNAGLNADNGDVVGLDQLSVTVVPEPTSLALVGLVAAVGVWRRRRRS